MSIRVWVFRRPSRLPAFSSWKLIPAHWLHPTSSLSTSRIANVVRSRQSISRLKQIVTKCRRIGVEVLPLFHCLGWPHCRRATHTAVSLFSSWSIVFKMQELSRILLLSCTQLLSSARARNISLHGNVSTSVEIGSNCTFAAGASSGLGGHVYSSTCSS